MVLLSGVVLVRSAAAYLLLVDLERIAILHLELEREN